MTPTHTRRGGRLYRYYASIDVIKSGTSSNRLCRVPAAEVEAVVTAQIKVMLQSPEIIVATWRAARKAIEGLTEREVADHLHQFEELWSGLFPAEQARIVQLLVDRVDLTESSAAIKLRVEGLESVICDLRAASQRGKIAA